MKKYIAGILVLLLLLGGCTAKPAEPTEDKLQVVVTIFPSYDFVRQIAGDRVELKMLLPPGNESHGYEPTLSNLSAMQKSDLLLYAGDDSDDWVQSLDASVYAETEMLALNHMVTRKVSDGAEHLWTSVRNAMQMVQGICDALVRLDPDNAAFYQKNTEDYLLELKRLDAAFADTVAKAPLDTLVFAERFPFVCFAEDYGLQWHAAFDHCSSDFEPKIDVIHDLIALVQDNNLPTVFYIEFSNLSVADTICAATGCEKALFHSCHNVTEEEFLNGETYLSLMEKNVTALRKALNYAA
ncbi:MAG: zinc ABC transporter substrate-binding protein [Clostridia bacterium]|nr:zinc ABC transporter substrate-binding protein [Clostridia bacterium]